MKPVYIPKKDFDRVRQMDCQRAWRARLFADMCRINTLYMIQTAGSGHIGSSFSSLDMATWIYLHELSLGDGNEHVYFSSKGHDCPGLYSVLMACGLLSFDLIHGLRRLDLLPGHPDVGTPGIVANTGSLGMGISKAKGMVHADRLQGHTGRRVFVMLGDGELQEGQIWESLASAVHYGMWEITAIVDRNRIQSDTWVDLTSPQGNIEDRFRACGWRVESVDGHDLTALESVFAVVAEEREVPQVIIAETRKGNGVEKFVHKVAPSEDTPYAYHSGALSPEDYDHAVRELRERVEALFAEAGAEAPQFLTGPGKKPVVSPVNIQRLIPAYEKALAELGGEIEELVVLDADLKYDCGLGTFANRFPERFFECGIAEQDMVSRAGAMALKGLLPVVHSFSCFLTTRPNENIYNNATEKSRVIYTGWLAGLIPAAPGHSHQGVRDIAALSGVPGLDLVAPSCEAEVPMALNHAAREAVGSTYLRMASMPSSVPYALPETYVFTRGRGCELVFGTGVVLTAYGPIMLAQACKAAELLAEAGISAKVLNMPWLNAIDGQWLKEQVEDAACVVTIDDHYVDGGQGMRIAASLMQSGMSLEKGVHLLGVNEIPACGQPQEVLEHHRLDGASIAQAVKKFVKGA
ncbi:transketolase C-terminal domain-containing protein [Pseudodesulfovibrio pelocollis]|uniref:transketolase C-terminal domain-containing protein n=1 Tax=Pseudodesulfovibrio pelocollis TaxID=3051432 RepID=UPI00255AF802|nr:transketolase C-terminal domain-containing protein [Pseudodesulfovibrio sp. SB368]